MAEDLCRHLASMCRMYNDYACVARDHEEVNLNSTDFPEFYRRGGDGWQDGKEDKPKDQLMWIAEYERQGMNMALGHLEEQLGSNSCGQKALDSLKLFIDVTDLYGLLYLIRDVSSRTR